MQLHQLFLQHPVICTDSRSCPKNSLFFALKGDNFNANAFALSALEKGCAFAVVDEAEYAIDERFILVEDTLKALQELALYHRNYLKTPIIGITGTNGKTTSKELISNVLKQKYNTHFTQGNLNNHIGVPLTLLQLTSEHEIAVVEMGANHPGEIRDLCAIACPDFGIITNVGKAHLEGFGSFEGVKSTKAELYNHIQQYGTQVFINADNEHLAEMAQKAGLTASGKLLSYSLQSTTQSCIATGSITNCSPFLQMHCSLGDTKINIDTQLIGAYNAENVLAAVAIGQHFGVEPALIKSALESYTPQNNRSQLTITAHNKLVVDAYNANPTSLRAAILNFAQMQVERKALIIGDMLELGEQSRIEHQNIIGLLDQYAFDKVYLVGPEFTAIEHTYQCFAHVDELCEYLSTETLKNYYILIKGSRGIKLEKTISLL